MQLLRSSAAQSGFFSRLMFLLGASFIYLLLSISPAHADEPTPSTDTSSESSPTPPPSSDSPSGESDSSSSTDTSPESNPPSDPEETSMLLTTSSEGPSTSPSTVTETITAGGDDMSYQIPITVPVLFNGVEYTNIYATTNSVITFGQPDGTYWDYPMTPSISLESRDWWARPSMTDEWFIIRTSNGGFQVDGSYRPFGQNGGDTTQIVITAQILTDGTVSYTYTVDGPLYGGERTGARLQDGTVVTLEEAGVTQVDEPIELSEEPVDEVNTGGDSNSSDSEGSESPGDSGSGSSEGETGNQGGGSTDVPGYDIPGDIPTDSGNPVDIPPTSDNQQTDSSDDSNTEEEQTPTEEESQPTSNEENNENDGSEDAPQTEEVTEQPQDNQEQENQSEESSSEPTTTEEAVAAILAAAGDEPISVEALLEAGLSFSDLPSDTPVDVRTDENGNPVIITAEVAAALQLLESPAALINGIFNCVLPSETTEELTEEQKCQVLAALANIGADMSPQEREEAQKMVVATVIAAGAAMNAVAAAAAATTTGGSSSGGSSSGGGAPTGDSKAVRRRRK